MEESFIQIITRLSLSNNELKKALEIAVKELDKKQEKLEKIKELARVNPINSCWTLLNTCDDCPEKSECDHDTQSPFISLKLIYKIIEEK